MERHQCALRKILYAASVRLSVDLNQIAERLGPEKTTLSNDHTQCGVVWEFRGIRYSIQFCKKKFITVNMARSFEELREMLENFATELISHPLMMRHPHKVLQVSAKDFFYDLRIQDWIYSLRFPDFPFMSYRRWRRILRPFLRERPSFHGQPITYPVSVNRLALRNFDATERRIDGIMHLWLKKPRQNIALVIGIEKEEDVIAWANRVHQTVMKKVQRH